SVSVCIRMALEKFVQGPEEQFHRTTRFRRLLDGRFTPIPIHPFLAFRALGRDHVTRVLLPDLRLEEQRSPVFELRLIVATALPRPMEKNHQRYLAFALQGTQQTVWQRSAIRGLVGFGSEFGPKRC